MTCSRPSSKSSILPLKALRCDARISWSSAARAQHANSSGTGNMSDEVPSAKTTTQYCDLRLFRSYRLPSMHLRLLNHPAPGRNGRVCRLGSAACPATATVCSTSVISSVRSDRLSGLFPRLFNLRLGRGPHAASGQLLGGL